MLQQLLFCLIQYILLHIYLLVHLFSLCNEKWMGSTYNIILAKSINALLDIYWLTLVEDAGTRISHHRWGVSLIEHRTQFHIVFCCLCSCCYLDQKRPGSTAFTLIDWRQRRRWWIVAATVYMVGCTSSLLHIFRVHRARSHTHSE